MKKKKILLALLAAGVVTAAGAFALAGCTGGGNQNGGEGGDNPPLGEQECKHSGATHKEAKAATCTAEGNIAYWYCPLCEKYFGDGEYKEEIALEDTVTDIAENAHNFGAWSYNYATQKYEKKCLYNSGHVSQTVQEAGVSAEFPRLVSDSASLKAAIAAGGYIKLEADIQTTEAVVVENAVNIDMNGKSVTSTVNAFNLSGNATLTLANGAVNAGGRGLNMVDASALTLSRVNIQAESQGIVSTASGEINIEGGAIDADSFGVYLIPGTLSYVWDKNPAHRMKLNIRDTEVVTKAAVGFWLIAADAEFTNTAVTVNNAAKASACVFAKGGTNATLTNCTLTNLTGSGLMGNGTRNTDEDVTLTLNNCTVTGGECALYLPQINSTTTVNGGTYTADATDPEATKSAIEIRGGKLTIAGATVECKRDNFKRTPNGNGSTVYGAALAVSQHTTNENVEVEVTNCTLIGVYAVYEWDQDTTNSDLIKITLGGGNTYNGGIYSENCDNVKDISKEPAAT